MKRPFTEAFCNFVSKELGKKYLDSIPCRNTELISLESSGFIMSLLYGPVLQTYRPTLGCGSDAFSLL